MIGNVAEVKLNSEALVPLRAIAVIVRSAVPLLVMVRFVGELLVPEIWLPNGMLVGANVIPGATPVPLRLTECGLPAELSVIDSAAVLLPVDVGENVTFTVVVLPGATVIGNVPDVKVNWLAFVPVMLSVLITRFAVPLLVITSGVALLLVLTS